MSTEPATSSQQPTPLINRAEVKKLAFYCGEHRAWKFTRISNEFYVGAEAVLRNYVQSHVAKHPSMGTTLR